MVLRVLLLQRIFDIYFGNFMILDIQDGKIREIFVSFVFGEIKQNFELMDRMYYGVSNNLSYIAFYVSFLMCHLLINSTNSISTWENVKKTLHYFYLLICHFLFFALMVVVVVFCFCFFFLTSMAIVFVRNVTLIFSWLTTFFLMNINNFWFGTGFVFMYNIIIKLLEIFLESSHLQLWKAKACSID